MCVCVYMFINHVYSVIIICRYTYIYLYGSTIYCNGDDH